MSKQIVTIMMSIHNKNECLDNTLFSISKQICSIDFNLCFIDHSSSVSPLPIIKKYFSEDKYKYKIIGQDLGFQHMAKEFSKMLPNDTEIVIWQSCDVIWADDKLLEKLISSLRYSKYKNKSGFNNYKDAISVPKYLKNYNVETDLYKNSKDFYNKLINFDESKKEGRSLNPLYLFLGALKRENFDKAISAGLYNSDAICDMVMRDILFKHFKLDAIKVESTAIHQDHIGVIYACSSINECTNPCKIRRRMIKNDLGFPWVYGYYNYKIKKFDNHPDDYIKNKKKKGE